MAWRVDRYVIKGEIQNQIPGKVTGLIWLKGLNKPLELKLAGNCYRDLAGARLVFENPHPEEGDYTGLHIFQHGLVGDITASKKVKILVDPGVPTDTFTPSGLPYVMANCLYLEWFSETNGRVLIETTDFKWTVTLPNWNLSENEESEQRLKNQQAMFEFMEKLVNVIEPDDEVDTDSSEMDEFQWEAFLQKSDARSDMLMELFEKYGDDPKCELLIADAMGWEVESIEYLDEIAPNWDKNVEEFDDEESDDSDKRFPNHPLISIMMDISSRIFFEAESRKLLNDESSNPWNQLLWHSQLTVSKLVSALEDVVEDAEPEPGFVVATLKRALHLIHLAIATLEAASRLQEKKEDWQIEVRKELFTLRESIFDLMQIYRRSG
ncbi:MAG: hypothetical protein HN763_02700 [Opitutales bacterium]|jgi:hypothetical protein|nr:hypothetical protein [Opitutales bacterium]MBT7865254.1 hypothetical protein [Opitutales bacterium]